MSPFAGIFVFVAVVVITAIVFGVWMIVTIVRLIVNGITALFAPRRAMLPDGTPQAVSATNLGVRCATDGCHMMNPSQARFCRRCGRGLPAGYRVHVRRAAVW